MIFRPLATTMSGYKPPTKLLFFHVYKIIKLRAIFPCISTEFIPINSYYIPRYFTIMYAFQIELLVTQSELQEKQ